MGLLEQILAEFEEDLQEITLIPASGGRFEVSLNGKLIYSKLATGRQAEPAEVIELIRQAGK